MADTEQNAYFWKENSVIISVHWVWWHIPDVPATPAAGAGESLKPGYMSQRQNEVRSSS